MRPFFSLLALLGIALLLGYLPSQGSSRTLLMGVIAVAVFLISFVRTGWGLYLLIFSMLLSPEIMAGEAKGGAAIGRGVTLRLEDFLLAVISISWLAKNAVHKELGLFLKTPLNRPIFIYLMVCLLSTGFGVMTGRVDPTTGFFFVLKYFEYIIVFFMVANHIESVDQIKRFIFCLLLTCLIISVVGILQIPGGERVTAPFEGETGEPNTLGGYLVFIGAVAAGMIIRGENWSTKCILGGLIAFIIPSFLYTQSRTSYLSLIGVLLFFGLIAKRKTVAFGFLLICMIVSPLFLPSAVKQRILFTITQKEHPGMQVNIGDIRLDTSTSARLKSWKEAVKDWTGHPVLGYGITGYRFIDAQFPRVLVETGIVGLAAFVYLLFSVYRLSVMNLQMLQDPLYQGIAVGFTGGFIGLLFHAIGANTFIIVRIMEPFWFVAGIVAVLPALEARCMAAEDYAAANLLSSSNNRHA